MSMLALVLALSTGLLGADDPLPKKGKDYAVPDLKPLIAKKESEFRDVATTFEADRGSLTRMYSVAGSPIRHARLMRFYTGWLAALQKIDSEKLGDDGRVDLKHLLAETQREIRQLQVQAASRADLEALVPFASAIYDLEESRRKMEPILSQKAAERVHELKKQIEKTRQNIEASLKDDATTAKPTKGQAQRSAEIVTALQATFKNWFGYYNGYDPLFSWWMASPYKEADKALQSYAGFLREIAQSGKLRDDAIEPREPPEPPNPRDEDVPDLSELMSRPQSEMRAVIQRFMTDRGGRFGRTTNRSKTFYADWLGALDQLDFDKLGHDGQIDCLLLKNQIQREVRRLELQEKPREGKIEARDSSGIAGRPIGRDALLAELAGEMIPYSPEEMIAIAEKEYAWCEAEMKKASREMGFGDDWKKAVEKVKTLHVEPGKQPELVRDLAHEAIDYLKKHDMVTLPPLALETWRWTMLTPERQLVSPFFLGGEVIQIAFPTDTMPYEAKMQSMRGNNVHFSRATVQHELIPGHHLQGFMNARWNTHRGGFSTPFWIEGWALYWEFVLYDRGFPMKAEDRVGFLFWRMHRCARIVFSFYFHLGKMSPQDCIEYLVKKVGHERDNATAEVRRSFTGGYGALYQAAYMLGGLQFRALRKELVDTGKMTERDFHDAILKENRIPIAFVRASLTKAKLTKEGLKEWRFYD